MMKQQLSETTLSRLARHPRVGLVVGFSGGLDSSVLLDVLAGLDDARARPLRALHVNHGLHPDAAAWARHCAQFCRDRDIELEVLEVRVHETGDGPEAAARHARMAAFAAHLRAGEALLLAQHRNDQAETILLKLLRGAGPHGLAGMRAWRPLANGHLWRPWLDVPRRRLREWAAARQLGWIEDPANNDPRMTRSWLRTEIMPRLRRHLPQAEASILRSGQLCATTSAWLDEQLDTLDGLLAADGSMHASRWLALPDALRSLQLERWLHGQGLPAPTTAQRHELERQAGSAGADRLPCVHWPGADVRVWRGHLHAMAPLPPPPTGWQAEWDGRPLSLPLGTLHLLPDVRLPVTLQASMRRGGEFLHPAGDACGRELRYVFQQAGLPPWLRPFCPLIHAHGDLLAVAGICLTRAGQDLFADFGATPHWRYHA